MIWAYVWWSGPGFGPILGGLDLDFGLFWVVWTYFEGPAPGLGPILGGLDLFYGVRAWIWDYMELEDSLDFIWAYFNLDSGHLEGPVLDHFGGQTLDLGRLGLIFRLEKFLNLQSTKLYTF